MNYKLLSIPKRDSNGSINIYPEKAESPQKNLPKLAPEVFTLRHLSFSALRHGVFGDFRRRFSCHSGFRPLRLVNRVNSIRSFREHVPLVLHPRLHWASIWASRRRRRFGARGKTRTSRRLKVFVTTHTISNGKGVVLGRQKLGLHIFRIWKGELRYWRILWSIFWNIRRTGWCLSWNLLAYTFLGAPTFFSVYIVCLS